MSTPPLYLTRSQRRRRQSTGEDEDAEMLSGDEKGDEDEEEDYIVVNDDDDEQEDEEECLVASTKQGAGDADEEDDEDGVENDDEESIVKQIVENTVNEEDDQEEEGGILHTKMAVVNISSNLRRTITSVATPYREDVEQPFETQEVICAADIHSSKSSVYKLHPLVSEFEQDGKGIWDRPSDGNIWCFHCCHPIAQGRVCVRIPQTVSDAGIYSVRPQAFCSLGCAKAHLLERAVENATQIRLLHRVARDVYGHTEKSIVPAPSRSCLAVFGGHIKDISTFRTEEASIRIRSPPFVPLRVLTETLPTEAPNHHVPSPSAAVAGPATGGGEGGTATEECWDVRNLRRPPKPQKLARGPATGTGRSQLEQYVEATAQGRQWDGAQFSAAVTASTPSIQEVNRAQATHEVSQATTLLPASAESQRRRVRRRRKFGADESDAAAAATGSNAAFDLSAYIDDQTTT